jgi:phenylpropionate dioxygenase-like ring-hydroxylating dioxygenase large terminal subunit
MLSREENDLLTRSGPGTPLGDLLRRHWVPALLSEEVAKPDCPPVRVRIMGESLIAFRDSEGRVAVMEGYCAHRRASLFWARNEECGLRCVYHGWKYDVTGQCVDQPNEPPDRSFKHKVKLTSYPVRDVGGLIWIYMGPPEHMPEMPLLEFTQVPASHRYVHKRLQQCNYLQNVEGEIDSSHVMFLHRKLAPVETAGKTLGGQTMLIRSKDTAPRWTVQDTDYGIAIGARRNWPEEAGTAYWRVGQFLMPTFTMIPVEQERAITFTAAIPIDDENMWGYTVTWRPDQPLTEDDLAQIRSWESVYTENDENFVPLRNKKNDYLIDREKQRTESFTGIRSIREQDMAVQEDQEGPIADRTREYLGTGDTAIIAMRRRLLAGMRDLAKGIEPRSAKSAASYAVRAQAFLAPEGESFEAVIARCRVQR